MDINYIKYGAEKYNEIHYSTPHNEKKYVLVSSTGADRIWSVSDVSKCWKFKIIFLQLIV